MKLKKKKKIKVKYFSPDRGAFEKSYDWKPQSWSQLGLRINSLWPSDHLVSDPLVNIGSGNGLLLIENLMDPYWF